MLFLLFSVSPVQNMCNALKPCHAVSLQLATLNLQANKTLNRSSIIACDVVSSVRAKSTLILQLPSFSEA